MRKAMMISALTLAMAGCAAQQGQAPQVQVRDLSASRERTPTSQYTVEAGDTLYGIAWRHNMDHRDLARINRIGPPYQIQPGQRLVLDPDAQAPARDEGTTAVASTPGVVATPLGGGQPASEDAGSMEWLLPDGTTEQGRRLSAQPLDEADGPTQMAMEGAMEAAGGTAGPGPVYDYDSPGADGDPSAPDLAERRAAEREPGPEAQEATPEVAATESAPRPDPEPEPQPEPEPAAQPERDAGTAVAGGSPAPDRSSRSYTPVEEVSWRWPVDGDIVGRFGEGGSITAGIDIAGQKGQPVRAAGPGIVVYAGSGVRGYGNLILLKHNDEYLSAYAHNDSLRVRENDVVEAGEVIATMGDSDAEDVRLHFEVRKNGQPQDPLNYLPSR
ncbi:MAG: peptidoglycan DD-metalloendopeptidase family protein [Halomonas sp.]|uniref:peptidoglycan DD-metalloendopeptidase family protein n=1 Tax=Halomonas sp. TaxID=1486246 RepID=UPI0019EFF4DE|nr:peptidoglycan DD-metalloendopeptidase family protein [Halomonas sp.]MBE0488845.1 peptidoglycan DD-metalloendopeptidase family protein [Halomonas sp.]